MKRQSISKKIRFEIFKRDSFTCQYCGKKVPDVILEVDHMNPVKENGTNELLNLITSCFECNRGKSDKKLSETHIIDKQRQQIEELQERRNQLDMMLDWKMELSKVGSDEVEKVCAYYNSKWDSYSLTDDGKKIISGYIKRFGSIKTIEAIDTAYQRYGMPDNESESFSFVLSKVKGVLLFNTLSPEKQEEWSQTTEILRRCKAKFGIYFDYQQATRLIKNFLNAGGTIDYLNDITDKNYRFSDWKNSLY